VFLICIYHSDNLMAYEYIDTLDANALHRYKAKLATAGLSECPFRSPADQWRDNPKEWPEVQYHDVYHYLINFPGEKVTYKVFIKLDMNRVETGCVRVYLIQDIIYRFNLT